MLDAGDGTAGRRSTNCRARAQLHAPGPMPDAIHAQAKREVNEKPLTKRCMWFKRGIKKLELQ
jgi:hypothetical protein